MEAEGQPRGAPLACGALGSFDRGRVERIARSLGGRLAPVHEDENSILMLDREPLEWSGTGGRGLAWVAGARWRGGAERWSDAARQGACGLAISGSPFVHSAIDGLLPVYWLDDAGAAYFATRLEPLARSVPGRLSVDWDAWSSTFLLRYPLGDRTPFAEIRRLPQHSTLCRREGRTMVESPSWPWAAIHPDRSPSAAAEAAIEALRESTRALGDGVICPLSGGRDSRILLQLLVEHEQAGAALTVGDDAGTGREEDLASPVADALGVRHEVLAPTAADYPDDWALRAERVEHQFVDHAWLAPLARCLDGVSAPVVDGFALDVWMQSGNRFYDPESLEPGVRGRDLLFDRLRRYGKAQLAFAEPLREPLLARVREQFLVQVDHYTGHPSQALLSLYATRSVRGVGRYPIGLLGHRAWVIVPGAADAFARAALSADPLEKAPHRMYDHILARFGRIGAMPTTNDAPRRKPTLPRRWRSEPAVAMYRDLLSEGPLAEHLAPELRAWLENPNRGELSGDLRLGMEAIGLFHHWWRRYRPLLSEPLVEDLRG
jgi:hypothetical protein